jgi:hypothetical protein
MSGRFGRKTQIAMLEAQNAALRELVALNDAGAIATARAHESSDIPSIEEMRDRISAAALIVHHLDVFAALRQLGYPIATMSRDEQREAARKAFDNDRVRELVRAALQPVEEAKDAMIARQVELALYGPPEQRLRSCTILAKVAGWYQGTRVDPRRGGITFLEAVKEADRSA